MGEFPSIVEDGIDGDIRDYITRAAEGSTEHVRYSTTALERDAQDVLKGRADAQRFAIAGLNVTETTFQRVECALARVDDIDARQHTGRTDATTLVKNAKASARRVVQQRAAIMELLPLCGIPKSLVHMKPYQRDEEWVALINADRFLARIETLLAAFPDAEAGLRPAVNDMSLETAALRTHLLQQEVLSQTAAILTIKRSALHRLLARAVDQICSAAKRLAWPEGLLPQWFSQAAKAAAAGAWNRGPKK